MIARIWRGAVRRGDSDSYAEYMQRTGIADYAATQGNRGVWMLMREVGELTEVVMFTLWDSLDAVNGFAGDEYETARFYPEDDRFLSNSKISTAHFPSPLARNGTAADRVRQVGRSVWLGRPPRRSGGVSGKNPIELGAGADVELEEHLAQVVLDRTRAKE